MYRPWVQWHVSADSQFDMIFLTIASDVIAKRMKKMFFFHGVMVMVFLFGANVEKWVNIQMERKRISTTELRKQNRNQVFRIIYDADGPLTKQEIAQRLHMSLPTVRCV